MRARFSRDLDAFREENASLTEGVPLESGGTLRVLFTQRELPAQLMNQHIADNRILALAMDVKEREPESALRFVTKDINLRIPRRRAGAGDRGLRERQDREPEVYMGVRELEVGKGTSTISTPRRASPSGRHQRRYPTSFALLRTGTLPTPPP